MNFEKKDYLTKKKHRTMRHIKQCDVHIERLKERIDNNLGWNWANNFMIGRWTKRKSKLIDSLHKTVRKLDEMK